MEVKGENSLSRKTLPQPESFAAARQAATVLSSSSTDLRNAVLGAVVSEIKGNQEELLAANLKDVEQAKKLVAEGELTESMLSRLKLDAQKLSVIEEGIDYLSRLEDPLGNVLLAKELDQGLKLFQITCPIGVVGVIFESRPDAFPQIASLCLKSGNAVILKGGKEALLTNRAFLACFRKALNQVGLPEQAVSLLETREAANEMLNCQEYIDLIVPRGSNDLVRHIQSNTRIPVLGHADGVCHIYIDSEADLSKAKRICIDAKTQYPSACNAAETFLVHQQVAPDFLIELVNDLIERGVEVRLHETLHERWSQQLQEQSGTGKSAQRASSHSPSGGTVTRATQADWSSEYCDLIVSVKTVDSIDDAIDHINRYGSHHTDAIVTENQQAAERFMREVDSAGVYWNASTRFADGFRYGFGAEVGISTGKLHPRGPVGLLGLVTYKYKLLGDGHIVSEYSGKEGRRFLHRDLTGLEANPIYLKAKERDA